MTATVRSATVIDLSWDADAVKGKLYRSTQDNFAATDGEFLGEFDSDSYTFADGNRTPETTYYYLFVPGSTDYLEGRVTVITKPQTSVALTATAKSPTSVELKWTGSAGKLYRSLQAEFTPGDATHITGRNADESDNTKLSYTNLDLTPGTKYYYILVPSSADYAQGQVAIETPDMDQPSVTFVGQNARACAGGIAGDDVHTFTITGTAKRKDENGDEKIVTEGTTLELSFENNRGHAYDDGRAKKNAKFVANSSTQHPQTIVQDSNGEQMTVTTDDKGQFKLSVLSSDIISSDINVKVKWKNSKGEAKDVGSQKCDFAASVSLRRFGLVNFPNEPDTGWIFNQDVLLKADITPVKVYLKFKKNPSIPNDTNYFNPDGSPKNGSQMSDAGNWSAVNGHQVKIRIDSIAPQEGFDFSGATSDYATILGSEGLPIDYLVILTSGDGAAQIQLKAGPMMNQAKEVVLAVEDGTER